MPKKNVCFYIIFLGLFLLSKQFPIKSEAKDYTKSVNTFGVPGIIAKFLDKRAEDIGSEINDASKILEDAKTLLSSLEEEHKKNSLSIKQMIENAKIKAKSEEDKSKKYIEDLIKSRILSAEEQVQSSERKIFTEIKETAIDMSFEKARARLDKELTEENYRLHFDQSMKMVKSSLTTIK